MTQRAGFIKLRSAGPDGKPGTADDFDAIMFGGIIAEETSQDDAARPVSPAFGLLGNTGAIVGTIVDLQGATITSASVSAKNSSTLQVFETNSSDDGHYLLRNLPAGNYEVRVQASATIFTSFAQKVFDPIGIRTGSGSDRP